MPASRIAVLGSCVSRDVWTLVGPPGARPVLYVDRTSLASMILAEGAANPLNGLVPPMLERWQRAGLAKETLAQLLALQPEALLVDFIDDRFDLLALRRGAGE